MGLEKFVSTAEAPGKSYGWGGVCGEDGGIRSNVWPTKIEFIQ